MSNKVQIMFPTGRLVQSGLYDPATKDMLGNPLTTENNQPRVEYWISVAIAKKETDWKSTSWGSEIYNLAINDFSKTHADQTNFSWKIIDGDAPLINRKTGVAYTPVGFKGCWIVKFKSGFAPKICDVHTRKILEEKNHINLGDYIQVFSNVASNKNMHRPGIYLNFTVVGFVGYGERIVVEREVDVSQLPFDTDIPTGVSQVPLAPNEQLVAAPAPVPPPYPQILKPPIRQMLPAAQGHTYETLIANGWTDESLIQQGMMAA